MSEHQNENVPVPRKRRTERFADTYGEKKEENLTRVVPKQAEVERIPDGQVEAEETKRVRSFPTAEPNPASAAKPVLPARGTMNAKMAGSTKSSIEQGYAGGRMGPRPSWRENDGLPVYREEKRPAVAGNEKKPAARKHPVLSVLLTLALLFGAALVIGLVIPEDAEGLPGSYRRAITGIFGKAGSVKRETLTVTDFDLSGGIGTVPADVVLTVMTNNAVKNVRLVNDEGVEMVETTVSQVNNTESNIWTLLLHVPEAMRETVHVQLSDGENWSDTDLIAELNLTEPQITEKPTPEAEQNPYAAVVEVVTTESPAMMKTTSTPVLTPEPTPEPTPTPTLTPEPTPEPTATPTPAPEAKADPDADPAILTGLTIYSGNKKMTEYTRTAKDVLAMPAAGDYVRQPSMGILTFRGNAFRENAAYGTVPEPKKMEVAWTVQAGSVAAANSTYYGIGWTGQPLITKWSKEVREKSNMLEEKKAVSGLKEVIMAGLDGNIYFLDLADGKETRNTIKLGYPMKATPSLHSGGYPLLTVGQYARKMKSGTGKIGVRFYNLYTKKETTLLDGLDGTMKRYAYDVGSFETSALIDRSTDTLVTAGTNGLLYVMKLNSKFDYEQGSYSFTPESVVMKSRVKGQKDAKTAVEASVAMYGSYVWYADMDGVLRCVDTTTMSNAWAVQGEDAVESTPALCLKDGELSLFTANLLLNRKKGQVFIRRYDALSGKEDWAFPVSVKKDSGKSKRTAGFMASPAVGENALGNLVFYTVTELSEAGCEELGIASCKAAVLALSQESGKLVWAYPLSAYSYSSPVAVYDENGNGWIIQASGDGKLVLLDGLTGREICALKVEGTVEASPAVYNDMLVIGTTGKKTSFIYGIRIGE